MSAQQKNLARMAGKILGHIGPSQEGTDPKQKPMPGSRGFSEHGNIGINSEMMFIVAAKGKR